MYSERLTSPLPLSFLPSVRRKARPLLGSGHNLDPNPTLRRQTQCMQHIFRDFGHSFADCTLRRLPSPYTTFISLLHNPPSGSTNRDPSSATTPLADLTAIRSGPLTRRHISRRSAQIVFSRQSLQGQFCPCPPRHLPCGQVCEVHSLSIITCGLTVSLSQPFRSRSPHLCGVTLSGLKPGLSMEPPIEE